MKAPKKYSELLQDFVLSNHDYSGEAMFQLGLMNFYGKGYPKNIQKGLKMIRQSAKMYPYANTFLGRLYLQGDGVLPDDQRALKYFQIAADQKESAAMIYLSSIYLHHDIVPYNPEYARELLEQAVSNRSDEAMVALGLLHLEEEFGCFDIKKAYDLFLRASNLGNTNAYSFLGSMYENGEPVKKDLKLALQYYLKGTSRKNILAHFFLGRFYLENAGPEFKKEAISHLIIAAEATHIEAMSILSGLLLDATPDYDPKTAIRYLHELATVSTREATLKLGIIYIEGIHTNQNIKRGLQFLRESKTIEAAVYMGDLYSEGKLVPYSYHMATNYYLIASNLGNTRAMCKMASIIMKEHLDLNPLPFLKEAQKGNDSEAFYLEGKCLLEGLYIEKNTEQAIVVVKKAMKMDFLPAKALYATWLYEGIILQEDKKKAVSLLKSLVSKGYTQAALELYQIYKDELSHNEPLAKKYLKIALDANITEASYFYALEIILEDRLLGLAHLAECIQQGYTPAINTYKQYR